MSYLAYISDENFEELVANILTIGLDRKQSVEQDFERNVIDPFATIFDAAISGFHHETWKESEMIRQCQKTLTNHIGALHQKVLGSVDGWEDLYVGGEVDLKSDQHQVIAEIKNKHNTLTGGRLADEYQSLLNKVSKKSSTYYGYTAYFVTIIPKTPARFNVPFTPSDRSTGAKVAAHEHVRTIDGASFYELVTGRPHALQEFYQALPVVIEHLMQTRFGEENFTIPDKDAFAAYFTTAFG